MFSEQIKRTFLYLLPFLCRAVRATPMPWSSYFSIAAVKYDHTTYKRNRLIQMTVVEDLESVRVEWGQGNRNSWELTRQSACRRQRAHWDGGNSLRPQSLP